MVPSPSAQPKPRPLLEKLFVHHYNHHEQGENDPVPFIDIYVNDDHFIQFAYGQFRLVPDDPNLTDLFEDYFTATSGLSYEPNRDHAIGWLDNTDWTGNTAFTHFETLLDHVGHHIDAITYAVEIDCPDGGKVPWTDFAGGTTIDTAPDHEDVADKREQLRELYDLLEDRDQNADGIPESFPVVQFYVNKSDDPLTYTFGPGIHSIKNPDEYEKEGFNTALEAAPNIISTTSDGSITATHHEWTPEEALAITEVLLKQIWDIDITDLTYVALTTPGQGGNISWTDV